MPFTEVGIPGLLVFEPAVFADSRGFFFESYNEKVFSAQGIATRFVQDNQSKSEFGVVRGLHYQLNPFAQTKLVRVLVGTILDVAVDIRKNSPTFGKVFSVELSAENKKQLYIPQGFAHGFSVLSEVAEVLYKCDNFYNKQSEGGIVLNDSDLKIDWKIPTDRMIISDKDKNNRPFAELETNFVFES
jgi:dTDP-4-dehydrorhamnose 3,5-epimerase